MGNMYVADKRLACCSLVIFIVLIASSTNVVQAISAPQSGDVRLVNVNDSTNMTGRLEVYYNGQWGTVCDDDYFDTDAAAVVCRQLGFNPDSALVVVRAGYGQGTGNIWLDEVFCNGTEENINSCDHDPWGTTDCDHSEDVGIICLSPNATQPPIQVRLVDGADEHEGRVEILYAGLWGTICGGFGFDLAAANIICRQLGYPSALRVAQEFGSGTGQIWLTYLFCTGNETSLEQCFHSQFGTGSCYFGVEARIECREIIPPAQFSARLIGGSTEYEGRVEFYYNGQWGTVCNDSWDINDAEVVCRQLHFNGVNETLGSAQFGAGTGPIWLDDVWCNGSEQDLSECLHNSNNSFGNHDCDHQQDAGVRCTAPENFDVRLRNGSTHSEGRVDVYYDGQWGAICDYGWDINDAMVICRQLGYESALRPTINSAYSIAQNSLLWLDFVSCRGNESSIQFCAHSGWGVAYCGVGDEAGVICTNETFQYTQTVQIRLINNGVISSLTGIGRVEVLHDGLWGTVCDDNWDFLDAFVVCRQLGFNTVEDITSSLDNIFGSVNNSVPIWLDNIHCIGNETNIGLCPHFGFGIHDCVHYEDSGVNCSNDAVNTNVTIRLVGSNNSNEGRVEVFFNGEWGTVCDDFWGLTDAHVVCSQLGYIRALSTPLSTQFGAGSGRIWMDNVQCIGSESKLWDCSFNGWGQHNCFHYEDASVICEDSTTLPDTPLAIRIVGGTRQYEGRVEIYNENFNGWGTICNQNWDRKDADVACRQLGYDGSLELQSYGPGSGPVYWTNMQCEGNEPTLFDCANNGWNAVSGGCLDHSLDAGVVCNSSSITCNNGDIRLVNGSSKYDGLLEVCYLDQWGTICGTFFGDLDAQVACRQLGLNTNQASVQLSFGYGAFTLLANVQCRGVEDRLVDCVHSGFAVHSCSSFSNTGIICPPAANVTLYPPGTVRLVDGYDDFSGRVEIFWNGVWGTVCDDFWDLTDARVVCRQLGYQEARQATTYAFHGPGTGIIWLDNVMCSGNETELQDCQSNGFGDHDCAHYEDAGVVCTAGLTSCDDGALRLVNGDQTEGRVEICFNNVWGTICDNFWDLNDARVVCRQLGFPSVVRPTRFASFGVGTGPIHLDNVMCLGNETRLEDCSHNDVGIHNCFLYQDAGVVCSNEITGPFPVRLVNGIDETEGRVEIFYNGEWGTICHGFWGLTDADVVCREIGCPYGATEALYYAEFGAGTGAIWLDNVQCTGTELYLSDCIHNGWGNEYCFHYEDAGVRCNRTDCNIPGRNLNIRLANSTQPGGGRVEIFVNGQWGTICDVFWGLADAEVACRDLGYTGALQATGGGYFGQGTGPIHRTEVLCQGFEPNLFTCPAKLNTSSCDHFLDAGVICITLPLLPTRLAGGSADGEGHVEVYYNDQWGAVCDDEWDLLDAIVVCSQLGFAGALGATRNSFFDKAEQNISLQFDEVQCVGTEQSLDECTFITDHNCDHTEEAGVICIASGVPGVRLIGDAPGVGRLEVNIDGYWNTVCDDGWSLTEADVVCKQLGFTSAINYTTGSTTINMFGAVNTRRLIITGNIECTGQENSLFSCPGFDPNVPTQCSSDHTQDIGVICLSTDPVRLSDGNSISGRVELFFNGRWGTVCDDEFDKLSGQVVCNQLNLGQIDRIASPGEFPVGNNDQPIWLDEVRCTGNEKWLSACTHSGYGTNECNHNKDVAIVCTGTTNNPGSNKKDDDSNNEAVLIGVLVPVLFILLVITAIVIIAIMYMVKRSRNRNADDKVQYLSQDDDISLNSTFSKGTSSSKDTTSTTGFANALYAEPDEESDEERMHF